jgi:hypothetical protein
VETRAGVETGRGTLTGGGMEVGKGAREELGGGVEGREEEDDEEEDDEGEEEDLYTSRPISLLVADFVAKFFFFIINYCKEVYSIRL